LGVESNISMLPHLFPRRPPSLDPSSQGFAYLWIGWRKSSLRISNHKRA
jgi:hypothetical protein